MDKEHDRDSDCTVDPETSTCTTCGVLHGEPCKKCGGRGYHEPSCPTLVSESLAREDALDSAHRLSKKLANSSEKTSPFAVDFCPDCQVRGYHRSICPTVERVLRSSTYGKSSPSPQDPPATTGPDKNATEKLLSFASVTLVFLEDWQAGRLTADEVERKIKIHCLARQIVNETVAGTISLDTSEEIARLTLPPLRQQWVRDQVRGIQESKEL